MRDEGQTNNKADQHSTPKADMYIYIHVVYVGTELLHNTNTSVWELLQGTMESSDYPVNSLSPCQLLERLYHPVPVNLAKPLNAVNCLIN